LWQYIKGVCTEAHLHVRRYPIEEMPHSLDELSQWLLARFAEKDELLDRFYATGRFAT
jgi:lysocardiolipin and lysophospholipid acyltransferase